MASPVMLSPHLSSEALRLRYRQCKDPADRTRWQALWLLSQEQHSQRQVAVLLDRSHTRVSELVQRYNTHGPESVPTHKRTGEARGGTPAALDAEGRAALDHALQHERPPGGGLWSGVQVTLWIKQRTGIQPHRVTGWQYLCTLSYSEQLPRPSHPAAVSKEAQAGFQKKSSP